jgi:hypothetical protein
MESREAPRALRKLMDVGDPRFVCPACDFDELLEPAWDDADAAGGGSQEICPNCKIQFGYDDAAGGDPVKRRAIWREWVDSASQEEILRRFQ